MIGNPGEPFLVAEPGRDRRVEIQIPVHRQLQGDRRDIRLPDAARAHAQLRGHRDVVVHVRLAGGEAEHAPVREDERRGGPGEVLVGLLGLRPGRVELGLKAFHEGRGGFRRQGRLSLGRRIRGRIRRWPAGHSEADAQARPGAGRRVEQCMETSFQRSWRHFLQRKRKQDINPARNRHSTKRRRLGMARVVGLGSRCIARVSL